MSRGMRDNSTEAQEAIGRLFDAGKSGNRFDGFMKDAASRIKEGRHVLPDDIADDSTLITGLLEFDDPGAFSKQQSLPTERERRLLEIFTKNLPPEEPDQ